MATLQTLDRGLQALMLIAAAEEGVAVADLARDLGIDRAIAYRIAATLEQRGLVTRSARPGPGTASGRLFLGAGVLALEGRFAPHFRRLAKPHLDTLAQKTVATAFVSVAEGDDCVAILVSEPEGTLLRVSYQVGRRHPVTLGAAGIAILSGRPESAGDSEDIKVARSQGYSVTRGILQKGAIGVASPIGSDVASVGTFEACVGVVAMEDLDVERAAPLVRDCALTLGTLLA